MGRKHLQRGDTPLAVELFKLQAVKSSSNLPTIKIEVPDLKNIRFSFIVIAKQYSWISLHRLDDHGGGKVSRILACVNRGTGFEEQPKHCECTKTSLISHFLHLDSVSIVAIEVVKQSS